MKRRLRWRDVWPVIRKLSGNKIKELRNYCLEVMQRAPPDGVLKRLRLRAVHVFCMFGAAFKLAFDFKSGDWVLNLYVDRGAPRKRPADGPDGRGAKKRSRRRTPARAARARPQRKATLKRILFVLYKTASPSRLGKLLPLLARKVGKMRLGPLLTHLGRRVGAGDEMVRRGARLEPRLFTAAGLSLVIYTFVHEAQPRMQAMPA